MKKLFASLLLCVFALSASAQVTILSTNQVMIGTTDDTTINVKALNNPIVWQGRTYRLPVNGTNFTTTNGVGVFTLVPGKYVGAYAGIPQSFQFSVTNSASTLNLPDLIESGHGVVFYSGVETLEGTGGIVVTPPTGSGGKWILDGSGITGGGGAALSTVTNVAQSVANTSSNLLQAKMNSASNTLNTAINTSSNSILANAQIAINTSSNSVLANAQTAINTSSNSILANAQIAINTSSNSVLANAQTAINTSSNAVLATAQTAINTASNSIVVTEQSAINTSSNLVYGNGVTTLNSASNSLQSQITSGGITTLQATGIVNSASGVIGNNGTDLGFKFSTAGTNGVSNIVATITAPLFDPASAAATAQANAATYTAGVSNNVLAKAGTNIPTLFNPTNRYDSTLTNSFNDYKGKVIADLFVGTTNVGRLEAGHAGDAIVATGRDDTLGLIFWGLDDTASIVNTNPKQPLFAVTGYGDIIAKQRLYLGGTQLIFDTDTFAPDVHIKTSQGGGQLIFDSPPTLSGANISSLVAANLTGTIPQGALPTSVVTNNWKGTITAQGFGEDQWLFQTNASDHTLYVSNLTTHVVYAFKTNGVFDVGGNGVATTNQLVSWASATTAGQFVVLDGSLNPSNTVDGGSLTNLQKPELLLAVTSQATNYTINVALRSKQKIFTANTNANFTFSNITTNKEIDLYIDALTSSVPCNITWPAHVILNHSAVLTVTNGQEGVVHIDFWDGTDPTNAIISVGDYYLRQ